MNSYNKLLAGMGIALVCVLVLFNGAMLLFLNTDEGRPYLVDINRAHQAIQQGADPQNFDTQGYTYLEQVSYLPESASSAEKAAFFDDTARSVIKVYGENPVEGYLRFDYVESEDSALVGGWIITNCALIVLGLLCLGILLFVRTRLVKPFTQISELPYELAKGHLASGLKEEKNAYFGRFLWGLDMLRETLEERKRNELALAKENKTMVLSLSHDIKTPLSAIRLYAKALSQGLYTEAGKQSEIAGSITQKVDEIEGFVQDIIKTSEEDFLHIEVVNREFYLDELIADVDNYYREKLNLIKCEFCIDDFKNILLFGDIDRYTEVMENIIENAIKYGDGKWIHIGFPVEDGQQCVSLTNSGSTLPEEELSHIFESFWRGSNAEGKAGSGLGLSICRQLMTQMQGEIFASIDAEASTMTLTLVPKTA